VKPGRKNTDAVEAITFWVVGAGLCTIPLLVFFFSFGNVGAFAESLGMPHRIAYLNGPAIDLAATVCVVASSYLSTKDLSESRLWPLHLATFVCGLMMILLNTAGALHTRQWRLASVDCVGPVLLIGWGALAPWLWRNLTEARRGAAAPATGRISARQRTSTAAPEMPAAPGNRAAVDPAAGGSTAAPALPPAVTDFRKPAAPRGGNVLEFAAAPGRRSAPNWAQLALPLWNRHVETTGRTPTATELAAALRHTHPSLDVPKSDRSERNIRSATEDLWLSTVADAPKTKQEEAG
jgi:hypothetical protein